MATATSTKARATRTSATTQRRASTTKPRTTAARRSENTPAPIATGADAPELRKKELIESVVNRSGLKKKDVKPTVEAMLAVLGEALADGRDMNLAPLGKIKINRSKDVANGQVHVLRVRQSNPRTIPAGDPLAETKD